jgi:predicted ATPase/DNA-binding CsgD family transcriptional regulator
VPAVPGPSRGSAPAGLGGRAGLGNLPADVSRFIGREREVSQVKGILSASRAVTLTGPGGVGKTRLALRVAQQVRRAYSNGVWLVDLTAVRTSEPLAGGLGDSEPLGQPVGDPQRLATLVARVLGIGEWSARPPLQALIAYLASRRVLLVLDNCEHLVESVAVLTQTLLHACPGVRVLATSRELLGVAGEMIFDVPPLSVPAVDRSWTLAELAACESVALLVARARAVASGFALSEDNRAAVAGICRRLDGVPLAIELAAAWIRTLTPDQVLARLADRFALLSRGVRGAPERQQTLQACVDWSFELCSKPERVLWTRLSAFAGGFEMDAVEGVCADELPKEDLPEGELLDLVAGLVDKSILVGEVHQAAMRYRMLETIRDYGRDQLAVAGGHEMLRRRHRDWYQGLVARADADLITPRQAPWQVRLDREMPNIRIALEFCVTEPGEAGAGLRMAVALQAFWWRGRFGEGRQWLDAMLAAQTGPPDLVWVRALYEAAKLACLQRDIEAGRRYAARARQLADHLGDERARTWARTADLGAALYAGEPARAAAEGEAVLPACRAAGDLQMLLDALLVLSLATWSVGDWDRAAACHEEILTITEPRGETWYRSVSMLHFGIVRWRQGQAGRAAELVRHSLRLRVLIDDLRSAAQCLAALAWIAGGEGDPRRAATLLGAAEALARDVDSPVVALPNLLASHQECERNARQVLGDQGFLAAFRHGAAWTTEKVTAYALGEAEPKAPGVVASPGEVARLTRRERQVVGLIVQGMTNKEIAARLVVSVRTAESHVDHILTKLSLANRAHIASWAATQGQSGAEL